jgi:hypothetical protein
VDCSADFANQPRLFFDEYNQLKLCFCIQTNEFVILLTKSVLQSMGLFVLMNL